MLGVVFSFVESDVTDKTAILRNLYSSDSSNYSTVQSMISYECFPSSPEVVGERIQARLKTGLTLASSPYESAKGTSNGNIEVKPTGPGSRTVLRLQRALNFLIEFVR